MGESVPVDMDGNVLTSALQPPLDDPTSICFVEGVGDRDSIGGEDLSEKDKDIIFERLRNLGYVG
jgi:hypothetical protein